MTRAGYTVLATLAIATATTNSTAAEPLPAMAQGGPRAALPSASPAVLGWVASAGRRTSWLAKDEAEPSSDEEPGSVEEDVAEGTEEKKGPDTKSEEASAAADGKAGSTDDVWFEQENTAYKFIGLRARMVIIPSFMFGLYQADGGRTVVAPVIGLEYVSRRNGFEYDAWLTYGSYAMDEAPFKAKSDPDNAYEIVKSELKVVSVGADFLWTTPIDGGVSFVYGGGAGIGAVFGDLRRNQAEPPSGTQGDPNDYVKCPAPGPSANGYCGNDNDHYGDYTEPNWFDGGSKPVIFPWIALPQLGMRWKPSRKFVLRVDTGLSFPGPFFFGVSGQYGLL